VAARARIAAQALSVALVAALLGLLVWKLVAEDTGGRLGAGDEAPRFTLPRLGAEGTLALESLRGKAVVVNFWASWCVPCKEEAAALERTWRERRGEELVVLGVNYNDLRADALRFVEDTGITYASVVDRSGELIDEYGLQGVPETFVLDREGRLVDAAILGPVDKGAFAERFRRNVDEALRS
jgi:cytochrome c biogenesis protein CcmG/thiol:disulfide interchange protein DsbE